MAKTKTKVKKQIKKQRKQKPIGFSKVDFFAGINTPSPDDDKRVSFVARNRGKKSPLELPSLAGVDLPSLNRKQKPKKKGLQLGDAEISGFKFDSVFGLDAKSKSKNPFVDKIGIDKEFGLGKFNTDFSKKFIDQEFDNGQGQSFDQSFDFGESTMISDDFEEPTEQNVLGDVDAIQDQVDSPSVFGGNDVPTLLDSVESLGDAERIPLTDEDDDMSKDEKLTKKFLRIRQEALETGGNPLTPEEASNFAQVKAQRNFGTTGRGRATGSSFGRF